MPRRGGLTRGLPVVSLLASALMGLAAINLVVVFVLVNAEGPTDYGNFLPAIAVGAASFVGTAVLIVWTLVSARAETEAGQTDRPILGRLLAICGVGLLLMVVCGFYAGFLAAAMVLQPGLPAADALNIYQYTFVAAVLADAVTLIMVLVARIASR